MIFNIFIGSLWVIKQISQIYHHSLSKENCDSTCGFRPYHRVVFWYPDTGTMMSVKIVAMLKLGHLNINYSNRDFSLKLKFPLSSNFFSVGILLGSCTGSG